MVQINAEVVKKLLLKGLKYIFKNMHPHFEHSNDNKNTVSNVKREGSSNKYKEVLHNNGIKVICKYCYCMKCFSNVLIL